MRTFNMPSQEAALQQAIHLREALLRLEAHPDWRLVIGEYTKVQQSSLGDRIHRTASVIPQLKAIGWFNEFIASIHDQGQASQKALEELNQQVFL